MKKIKKIAGIIACSIVFTLFALGSGSSDSSSVSSSNVEVPSTQVEIVEEPVEEVKEDSLLGETFDEAVKAIGMDPEWVKNVNELDDWSSGKRYSFVYDGFEYKVYVLDNGEINSICNENLSVKIFERGYQPLNYKDFEPDSSITGSLSEMALKEVAKYILNEDTLKNKLGFSSFYRIYNYYSYSGEVVAKNENDKETYEFTVDFLVEDNAAKIIYVSIDGVEQFSTGEAAPEVEKVALTEEGTEASGDKIVITDGKLGDYGQEDMFDGEPYMRYYLPNGKYNVKCVIRGGFYIESIALHKEDGWDTATTYDQIMMNVGDEKTITIEDGQCISLIINTELEFTPVN